MIPTWQDKTRAAMKPALEHLASRGLTTSTSEAPILELVDDRSGFASELAVSIACARLSPVWGWLHAKLNWVSEPVTQSPKRAERAE